MALCMRVGIKILLTFKFKIDEKGTLKATEHNKYENIAGSV
jgi:hypothetical protein